MTRALLRVMVVAKRWGVDGVVVWCPLERSFEATRESEVAEVEVFLMLLCSLVLSQQVLVS